MSDPIRVVSLVPSATEIVCLLGREDALVGVTSECDFPPGVGRLPHVVRSSFRSAELTEAEIDGRVQDAMKSGRAVSTIDEALLVSLAPNLVLAQRLCDVCAVPYDSVLASIEKLPTAPRVLSLHPHTIEEVLDDIRRVAAVIGAGERVEIEIERLSKRLSDVAERLQGVTRRPRVAALEWLDPLMASGHWVVGMIDRAGGRDFLGRRGEPSVRIEWSELLRYAPEVLVLMPCGFGVERASQDAEILTRRPGWESIPAVVTGEVYAVDGGSYFNRSGPRLVDGVEILAEILHPEVFGRRNRREDYRQVEEVLA